MMGRRSRQMARIMSLHLAQVLDVQVAVSIKGRAVLGGDRLRICEGVVR